MSLIYLYGIARDTLASNIVIPAGIGGEPARVESTLIPGVALLSSTVSHADVPPSRRNLLTHTKVLESVMSGATLLPMRFGMVVNSADLPKLFANNRTAILDLLDRLDGRVEIALQVAWNWRGVLAEIVDADPRLASHRNQIAKSGAYGDRIAFGDALARRLSERREAILTQVVTTLAPHAVDHRPRLSDQDDLVCDVAWLVEAGRTDEFEESLERLDASFDGSLTFRVVAPVPAYSFVDLRLG